MATVPTLYTPRLTLRPFVPTDAARVRELAGDARIAATTGRVPHPYPEGEAERFIEAATKDAAEEKGFVFAVTLAGTRTPGRELDVFDTGHLIGSMGLAIDGNPEQRRAILGYWIGVPYWNKGFATEAGRAVLSFAFTRRNLNRVTAKYLTGNPASGRVMEKLGLTREGILRRHFLKNGEFHDVVTCGILQEEWTVSRKTSRLRPSAALQPA